MAGHRREAALIEQDLATEQDGVLRLHSDALATLRRRELLRVAGEMADTLGSRFVEARAGTRVEGNFVRRVETHGGPLAVVEKSREFTLVPWRAALERQIGKSVSGIMRETGVSWTFGRERGGPAL